MGFVNSKPMRPSVPLSAPAPPPAPPQPARARRTAHVPHVCLLCTLDPVKGHVLVWSDPATLQECAADCRQCRRCNCVSFSQLAQDCSWYYACRIPLCAEPQEENQKYGLACQPLESAPSERTLMRGAQTLTSVYQYHDDHVDRAPSIPIRGWPKPQSPSPTPPPFPPTIHREAG